MKIYQKQRYHIKRWRQLIEPLIPKDGKDRKILDLGCNAGFYIKKAQELGYKTVGVEKDPDYIIQAPRDLNVIEGDINYYKPDVCFLTLCTCVHYHQTDEQVEALLHNLLYSTAHVLIMGRNKQGRTKTRSDRRHIVSKLRWWKFMDGKETNTFYTVLFRNPRCAEFDVDNLYDATVEYIKTVKGYVNYVPSFENYIRRILSGEKDIKESEFLDHLIQQRRKSKLSGKYWKTLKYPLGLCWLWRLLIEEIQKNGLNEMLIVKNGRIHDGFHRLIILRELGVKRVICTQR